VGKTTTAAWAIAHFMLFTPGSLERDCLPGATPEREAVRRVRDILIKVGAELKSDNVYGLELKNGSRVLALPGSDDSIRGLTVDGWIVADEAARLANDLISAVASDARPPSAARFAMLSTAWSRTDPFWTAWRAKPILDPAESNGRHRELFLRAIPGEGAPRAWAKIFNREYLGIPGGGEPVRSAGSCMSARRRSMPWCHPVRRFNHRLRKPAVRVANPFQRSQNQPEPCDDLHIRTTSTAGRFQAADHRP
jgi:hypothetical protein